MLPAWLAGTIGWQSERHHYGPYPLKLLAQLEIDYADGTPKLIVTTDGPCAVAQDAYGKVRDVAFVGDGDPRHPRRCSRDAVRTRSELNRGYPSLDRIVLFAEEVIPKFDAHPSIEPAPVDQ